jgi:hypothetical protein
MSSEKNEEDKNEDEKNDEGEKSNTTTDFDALQLEANDIESDESNDAIPIFHSKSKVIN